MTVRQTQAPASPPVARVSHALNALLALGAGCCTVLALAYGIARPDLATGGPYLVIAAGCALLLGLTALAEFGFLTAHRWARAATCVAWLAAWPALFVVLTWMVVDGAAALLAFFSCLGACSVGIAAVGDSEVRTQ